MNLTTSPNWLGGYNYHIGVNSPFYINATNFNGVAKYITYLYVWNGSRNVTTPIAPIIEIEKEVLNQHSFYFDISDYLKPHIQPQIHDFLSNEDYDLSMKWVAYKIVYYNASNTIIQTYNSPLYFASYGFRYNELSPNAPDVDSDGYEYPIYSGTDKHYKLNYLPIKQDDLNFYYNMMFTADKIYPSQLVEYYSYVNEEMTPNKCAYTHQICFINRFGIFEFFPLYGKVTQTTQMSKEHFTSVIPNQGYIQFVNYKPELSQKSESKYSWSSIPMSEVLYLKLEEINHSPLLFLLNSDTRKFEQVYIPSNTYTKRTHRNDKINQTYNIEFVSVFHKKK